MVFCCFKMQSECIFRCVKMNSCRAHTLTHTQILTNEIEKEINKKFYALDATCVNNQYKYFVSALRSSLFDRGHSRFD